jgi:alkylation response protein AidB-like acyl-CoA dehydrogenase
MSGAARVTRSIDNELDCLSVMDDDTFRTTVREWIVAEYPKDKRNPMQRPHYCDSFFWYQKLSEKGWIAPGWPREYGGMGLSAIKQLILLEEQERYGCTRFNDLGICLVGPLLIRHGTEDQKNFYLPKIISGEHIWCQGYSEPNSGSDLASLRTEAKADGDDWIINGQKIWTTLANDANWIFTLVRTRKSERKHDGISFILVPMSSPGLSIRPILTLDMHDEFCETFFDNVRVPNENVVGTINDGWAMANALLGFERLFTSTPRFSVYCLSRLKMLAEYMGIADDPLFVDRYTRLRLDLADFKALYATYVDKLRQGTSIGSDISILKTYQTELYQRITDAFVEISGEYAGFTDPIEGNKDLRPGALFLQARPASITSGTSQIQRNIIAKRVLDLPTP